MNRIVRLGELLVRQGVVAIALLAACVCPTELFGQQTGQSQSVPDAPTPQQSDSLGKLAAGATPGKGAQTDDQNANSAQTDQGTKNPGANSAPAPSGAASQTPNATQEQQTPPVISGPGEYNKDLATFVTRVNFVAVPVMVLDKKHQEVAGLTYRDFRIYENNVPQHMSWFSTDAVPLSVALVIDQSLPRDTMSKVNASLAAIQGAFTASDEIAVFTYGDGVNNPTDFTAALSARIPAVLQASKKEGDYMGAPTVSGPFSQGPTINGLQVDPNLSEQRGNSGFLVLPKEIHTLNDAILAAGKALSTRPKEFRRIIYVISDGKESRSKANFKEVVRYLEGNHIQVYGTLVGDSATWGLGYLDKVKLPLLPLSPDNILPRYTDATGGTLYSEFSENGIQRSFASLAALARTQYTLGYYSKLPVIDGRYRTIEVDVLRPNVDVVAPRGYYPTATNLSR
ncbi:MAG TPA: VWA domain-containing protein [Acidobacteriaceae bacterium]|nr:VWA domain-containing protein [Acidobacteriaceae bacterium]